MLVLVSVLPLVGFASFAAYWDVRNAAEQLRDQAHDRTHAFLADVERYVGGIQTSLQLLAAQPSLQTGQFALFQQQLAAAVPVLNATGIVLVDRDGQQIVSSRFPYGSALPRRVNLEAQAQVFRTGRPAVSDLVIGAASGLPILSIEVPVYRDGAMAYVLAAGVVPAELAKVLDEQSLPQNWFAGIFDRKAVTIARIRDPARYVGTQAGRLLREKILRGDEAWFLNPTREGVPVYSSLLHSPGTGLAVSVGVPAEEVNAPVRQGMLLVGGIGLACLALALLVALRLGHRIAVPVHSLAEAALALGRGRRPALPAAGVREVDEVGAALETAADVLERRLNERDEAVARARANEEQQRELLATIDLAAVFVRELDGAITFWSHGCERLYGWTAAEAMGRDAHALLQAEFPAPRHEIQDVLLSRGEWQGDVRQTRRDGTSLTASLRKVLRRDADGRPTAILESVADVTALRRAEAQLRALNEELEARVHEEVAARDAAQARAAHAERIQALGQLAGGIAHDFNNVLQGIQGGAALIRQRAKDAPPVQRLAGMILDAAERGASITRRLLAFARRGDLRAEPIAAADLLADMSEVLVPALGPTVRLQVDAPPDLPPMFADKSQLETVLVNLATNARDAMPQGGTLLMSARPEEVSGPTPHPAGLTAGRYIRLTVSDTGHGMDAGTLGRALEPFFTTKPPGQGTGLGLSMTKGFAEQSGGGLAIESRVGEGTTVMLWLPQAERAQPAAARVAPDSRQDRVARVLLVDDEAGAGIAVGPARRTWVRRGGCGQR